MNTETLRSTGLTHAELGDLFGVSRITVLAWMNGRFRPHHLHRESVEALEKLLAAAVKDGKLPLPTGVGKPARIAAARRAIGLTD